MKIDTEIERAQIMQLDRSVPKLGSLHYATLFLKTLLLEKGLFIHIHSRDI